MSQLKEDTDPQSRDLEEDSSYGEVDRQSASCGHHFHVGPSVRLSSRYYRAETSREGTRPDKGSRAQHSTIEWRETVSGARAFSSLAALLSRKQPRSHRTFPSPSFLLRAVTVKVSQECLRNKWVFPSAGQKWLMLVAAMQGRAPRTAPGAHASTATRVWAETPVPSAVRPDTPLLSYGEAHGEERDQGDRQKGRPSCVREVRGRNPPILLL